MAGSEGSSMHDSLSCVVGAKGSFEPRGGGGGVGRIARQIRLLGLPHAIDAMACRWILADARPGHCMVVLLWLFHWSPSEMMHKT